MKASNFGHFRASKLVQNCRITFELTYFSMEVTSAPSLGFVGLWSEVCSQFQNWWLKKGHLFWAGVPFFLLGPHFLPCEGLQKVGVLELQLHLNIVFLKIGSSKIHSMNIDIFESLLCIFDSYSITIYFQQDLTYVLHESFELIV